jgi:hypothetical protein
MDLLTQFDSWTALGAVHNSLLSGLCPLTLFNCRGVSDDRHVRS